jgi:ABC-type lipoprotein release transport system permease subunit
MGTAFKLAIRNLVGAGLRTWLNVIVLSFAFLAIIWMRGLMIGWEAQARRDTVEWQLGNGQYWHTEYDPYDPFSLEDSRAPIPKIFSEKVSEGSVSPSLIVQGTLFPKGRMLSVLVHGVVPDQKILKLPTAKLDTTIQDAIPAVIGNSEAVTLGTGIGDKVTLRWRDKNGTFDIKDIQIVGIFACNVPETESGKIYIPIDILSEMLGVDNEATIITVSSPEDMDKNFPEWIFKPQSELTEEFDRIARTETIGQSTFYLILLFLAMLGIYDTQILSVFRRQKEIGTYIALGYTQKEVVMLFTIEGTMHSFLAILVATIYGLPLLLWNSRVGITMPIETSDFGISMAQTIYPVFKSSLIIVTIVLIVTITVLTSYWPSKKIAKMNPTEALRGKVQ